MGAQQLLRVPSHADLSKLARDDPSAFETLRQALIAGVIDRAPERIRARLRGLQFQIDGVRRLARSPLGATVKICGLMWDSFLQMNDGMRDAVALVSGYPRLPAASRAARRLAPPAKVLPFRQRACGGVEGDGRPAPMPAAYSTTPGEQSEPALK